MTLMLRRRSILLALVTAVIATLVVAVVAYVAIRSVAPSGDPAAKVASERVLFISIIASAVCLSVQLAVLVRSTRLSNQLDRLVEMNRLSGYSAEVALNRMGDVGPKIATLYAQMSELSEKKSRKIAALTTLNDYLMNVMSQLVIVADATGRVVQASKPVFDRLEKVRTDVVGQHIDDLIPNAEAASAIREMDKSHMPVVRERRGDSLVFSPVIDRDNHVAYLVIVLTRTVTDEMKRIQAPGRNGREDDSAPLRARLLSRLFRRRR